MDNGKRPYKKPMTKYAKISYKPGSIEAEGRGISSKDGNFYKNKKQAKQGDKAYYKAKSKAGGDYSATVETMEKKSSGNERKSSGKLHKTEVKEMKNRYKRSKY